VKAAACSAFVLLVLAASAPAAPAPLWQRGQLERVNRRIAGQVLDFTANHGADNRLWSEALQEKRDLYVYLPPHFDPHRRYPLMLWLHGFAQDEGSFLSHVVEPLDQAIRDGKLPPMIVAAPDGSLRGLSGYFSAGSFYLNTPVGGDFEDYLMRDVWDFLFASFPLRPEREAHVIAGVSMGAGAAYNKAIKYRDRFAVVVGIFPPVNVRWSDCHGRYMANFHPDCIGWKTDFDKGLAPVARFYGVIVIRQRSVVFPLYGRGNPDTTALISRENPLEMLDALDVQEGQLAMYIAYGGKDQFNLDAQVESFLYRASQRGLTVGVGYEPHGRHDVATAMKLLPGVVEWLGGKMAAYFGE
jgi:S-formylglutathione hydrolase FrmB